MCIRDRGLPRPIIKTHPEEKIGVSWARRAPQYFGVSYNIYATAASSDFKFGRKLGFAKAHHKITRIRKGGMVMG